MTAWNVGDQFRCNNGEGCFDDLDAVHVITRIEPTGIGQKLYFATFDDDETFMFEQHVHPITLT
jgi:hypothetical protein